MVGGSSRCVDTCAPLIREHGVMHHTWRPPSCLLFHVAGGMHPLVAWACDESGLCVYTKRIACIHKASLCTQEMLCVYTEQAGVDTMMSIVCIRNIRTRSRGWMCIHIEQSRIHNIRSHMHHTVLEYTHRGGADSPAAAAASPLPPSPSRCRNAWFCFMVSSRCFSNADNSGATSSSSSTGMLLSGTRKRTTSAFATQMASQMAVS